MDVIPRYALAKVRHSERSEESALVRLGPELQILRSAQDDSDFHLHEWACSNPAGWASTGWCGAGVAAPRALLRFRKMRFFCSIRVRFA